VAGRLLKLSKASFPFSSTLQNVLLGLTICSARWISGRMPGVWISSLSLSRDVLARNGTPKRELQRGSIQS